ncbi:MAG: GWxTD domain-containing protein [Bacteroidota bacterium]
MLRRAGICLLILVMSFSAKAIEVSVFHNIFYLPDTGKNAGNYKPYIEVYWEINPQSINFVKTNDLWLSKIRTHVVFSNDNGKILEDHFALQTRPTANVDETMSEKIMDLHRYVLPYGHINMEIEFAEAFVKADSITFKDTFTINPPKDIAFYSGVQLLDTVIYSNDESAFLKNGVQQIPLSINYLDDDKNVLHYYAECYNSDKIPTTDYPLVETIYVATKGSNVPLYNLLRVDTIKAAGIRPIFGNMKITALASGNYYLNIVLENKDREKISSNSLFFQRSKKAPEKIIDTSTSGPQEKFVVIDLTKTFVEKYDIAQLKAILKMLVPISKPVEVEAIRGFTQKPDETYMRYFLYNFWTDRAGKKASEAWKAYTQKVIEVNKLFGSSSFPGYETDRGLVYLKYGAPVDRIKVENEAGSLPYEIWLYNAIAKQSTGLFLFYRPTYMVTDFKLLHSTVIGEVRNAQWRSILYANGTGSQNQNSRADEYFQNH